MLIRYPLVLVMVLLGMQVLTGCVSRRGLEPYVYVPHRVDGPAPVERERERETDAQRGRRAPRSRASQEEMGRVAAPAPVVVEPDSGEEVSSRRRLFGRSRTADQDEASVRPEVIVVEQETIEESPERSGMFGFLRRSPRDADSEIVQTEAARTRSIASSDPAAVVVAQPEDAELAEVRDVPIARGYRLRPGDQIVVSLRGIEERDLEYILLDDGYINPPYITPIQAEGLTISELQRMINDRYIDEQIYRSGGLSVTVLLPTQYYFVRGEVRQPGRYPLTSGMTVVKAIAAAGGYTEFANPRRVEVIRAGETITGNARQMEQNPEEDFTLKAGDVIIVRRSIF